MEEKNDSIEHSVISNDGKSMPRSLEEFKRETEIFTAKKIEKPAGKRGYSFFKRMFDIILSVAALLVLLLPMAVIAIIICIDSKGGPLYFQERLGLYGKPFILIKFRSMRSDAEKDGAQWACEDDKRVTRFGKWLRRTRFDETPQFINILLGQMSMVGPRPERKCFYDAFDTFIVGYRQRMYVKPGLTGWAQVNCIHNVTPQEKIKYDIEYIENRSIMMDLKCIFKVFGLIKVGKRCKAK